MTGVQTCALPISFIRNYVLRGGFRDGATGLLVSRMNAYYVFLKLAKLWELQLSVNTARPLPENQQSTNLNPTSAVSKSAIGSPKSPVEKS